MTDDESIASVLRGDTAWCVVTGDCREMLARLDDGAVDHVISDPPYDERTHRGAATTTTATSRRGIPRRRENGIAFAPLESPEETAREFVRIARRWAIAFCAEQMVAGYVTGAGENWVRLGVWDKLRPTPQLTGDRPGVPCELLAIMHRRGRKRWNGGGTSAMWRCVVEMGRKRHPTAKPISLMRKLVLDFTDPGDVILDPYCGSGSTGVAAVAAGRRFVGIEINDEYAAIARERIAEAADDVARIGPPRKQMRLEGT